MEHPKVSLQQQRNNRVLALLLGGLAISIALATLMLMLHQAAP